MEIDIITDKICNAGKIYNIDHLIQSIKSRKCLSVCSILSLVVGLYYIVTAEVKERKRRMEQSEDSGGVP